MGVAINKTACAGDLVRVNDGFVKYYGTPKCGIVSSISTDADRDNFVIVSFGCSQWTLLQHEFSVVAECPNE